MSIPRFFSAFLRRFWCIACKKKFWSKIWTELGCQPYFIIQLFNQGPWSRKLAAPVKVNNIYGLRMLSEGRFDVSLEYLSSFRKKKLFSARTQIRLVCPQTWLKIPFSRKFSKCICSSSLLRLVEKRIRLN